MIEALYKIIEMILFPGFAFIGVLSLLYEWIDRKFYARLQNRIGPLYAGPHGILQPLADFIKLLSKEDIIPEGADKFLFTLTPILFFAINLLLTLFLPICGTTGVISFTGDLIFFVALLTIISILVYTAGMASTNRFATIGAERAVLQLIGYEIPFMLSIVSVAISSRSLTIKNIVESQSSIWHILGPNFLAFIIFAITAQAELERIPFDIPEAEQEIVAGWLVEYSGKKLALFRLGKDVETLLLCGLGATLFLGGPLGPVVPGLEIVFYTLYFIIKSIIVLLVLTTLRALFARLRVDQMLVLSWKYLIPLSLISVLIVRVVF
ncbi:MAG: NADH-quinone oxidoreductase subunit H [Thermoprotei archaeon]|nr:MAG: NADH-quinone oxidoreductase subunit H [Thermoprotei archaeon]RLG85889.1 MAG: NADH-quinone oxidoreductase subunit H [Thermoprotei archaeon]